MRPWGLCRVPRVREPIFLSLGATCSYRGDQPSQDLLDPRHDARSSISLYESVHAVSGRQATVPDTGTAAWPLESSLVAWYARPATICTAALSWRSVRGRCRFGCARGRRQLAGDTQNVDISWYKHAGGAGKLLQSAWCCILPSAHPPSSTAPPRHRMELQIAARERPPRTRPFDF